MESSVRRRDTTKGPPLRILSLDGGGVKGYSMLIIIQDLMHRTFVETYGRAPRRDEIPKPADHFDLIVGTGTGGLIALMLGRLRLDLETCKELYTNLTRMVFQTDKTLGGIPLRSTMFKASKLEEAIRDAVKIHTALISEGNDGSEPGPPASSAGPRRHVSNASVVSFSARGNNSQAQIPMRGSWARYGNSSARLYDGRENRTKTAVTAVYKGTSKGGAPALLRSYDSRREPPPEFDCKIWQAGRATCAVGMAFKPITIGQSCFHDDGAGSFNPSPEALDEAVINEWPGREVGVFISVGTGKRPKSHPGSQWQWYDGFLGDWADARRNLIAKIEECEKIHERMIREYLPSRGVNIENYFRFNVEVGVGEFAMNEWSRLAEIATNTRRYLARDSERKAYVKAATKIANITRAVNRHKAASRATPQAPEDDYDPSIKSPSVSSVIDDLPPNVVELAAEVPQTWVQDASPAPSRRSYESGGDNSNYLVSSPRNSNDRIRPGHSPSSSHSFLVSQSPLSPGRRSSSNIDDPTRLMPLPLSPQNYRINNGSDMIAITSPDEEPYVRTSGTANHSPVAYESEAPIPLHTLNEPPPRPPKTPFQEDAYSPVANGGQKYYIPPYPDDDVDVPPPIVYMDRKPKYSR
ncbi:hypothetical protein TD95_004911 [Thielaviopsis punctulata]|uniref:PNPLA domain-containing protein n=1 Tax=Thielaviopsis punctulata TaxID=72032 RepID=A0A0F4ZI28_9PEZI|nr:hypothetical protein TD95_004911 [Thielaviopsis punctulata]